METKEAYRVREETKVYKFPTFESQLPELVKQLRYSHRGNVRFPMIDLLSGRTERELIVVQNNGIFDMPVIRILTKDMLLGVFEDGYRMYQDETHDEEMLLVVWIEIYFGDMREIKHNLYSSELISILLESDPPKQYEDPSMKIGFEHGYDEPRHVYRKSRLSGYDYDM